jgi:hypothetical protein
MKKKLLSSLWVRLVLGAVACVALSSCAALHASPNGPGDCVGPPDYCVPFFGS